MSSLPLCNSKMKHIFTTKARYKVLVGGRASGKTVGIASHLVLMASEYSLKILCVRSYQSSIKDSVHSVLKGQIERLQLPNFEITLTSIRHKITGAEFIFKGVALNVDEIKSTEDISIIWWEEAHSMTKEQFDIVNPTLRKEGSEMIISFNPQHRNDFVFQNFVEHPHKDSIVLKINYDDNPYLSETMKSIIDEERERDYDNYLFIYGGKPHEGDDKSLFGFTEIENAMNEDLEGVDKSGVFSYAVDVARYGSDKGCLTKRRGYHIYGLQSFNDYSTMETANAVAGEVSREDKRPNAIFIDTIGVGSGVYDRMVEKGFSCIDSNVSMKADLNDVYTNKRAEMFFLLRDFIRKGGKIPNDEELKEELLAIRYFYSKINGKIQIQAKDDIKELIGRSPDKADSVALHFFSEVRIEKSDFVNMSRQSFIRRGRRR